MPEEEKGTVAWLFGKINSQVIAWMVTQWGFEDRLFKAPGRGNSAYRGMVRISSGQAAIVAHGS